MSKKMNPATAIPIIVGVLNLMELVEAAGVDIPPPEAPEVLVGADPKPGNEVNKDPDEAAEPADDTA